MVRLAGKAVGRVGPHHPWAWRAGHRASRIAQLAVRRRLDAVASGSRLTDACHPATLGRAVTSSLYDEHLTFYLEFVGRGLAGETGLLYVLLQTFEELLGDRTAGARVLDLACGEGYVARHFADRGAREVIGIDISLGLIEAARSRAAGRTIDFHVDDAQVLATLQDDSCDIVVSQMALMDIPDHRAAFGAVRRVLRDSGVFIFSILHPALEGAPFHEPERPKFICDEAGRPVAQVVARYATEGYWKSGGTGVRGRMGSYHRMISTYSNDLIDTGFSIECVREPVVPNYGLAAEVPQTMVIAATSC